ncbi:TadE-like protein [Novosphingobium aromaticivorans DSM 12444]|uniref:TadE-like protein n=1 Tax=Novosphingobium aromaticivorans (strain ATCC 700278 / DSM 12444 / CCUG 56034 / CIP 105152 / NBRC 16084 / F199) TaxID=279238 RepID=Q2G723_NOVAD|nr:TadE/TadG family type IV pilus assembly protein [Novosphingobium aromaticivorans]ABD26350.1 TadE-like protein [Novosphingobium aromaticivorans DSM 12444]SCY53798.1 TadE-like protein [Novosphingobium aromaticivorans]
MKRLFFNREGAAAVEFALVGPLFIALLLAVFQFGAAAQSYNALRAASADVQRHVVVEYQAGNRLTSDQIGAYALAKAQDLPYILKTTGIDASAVKKTTSRVSGTVEYTLNYTYNVPNVLSAFGFPDIALNFSRPIFVSAT